MSKVTELVEREAAEAERDDVRVGDEAAAAGAEQASPAAGEVADGEPSQQQVDQLERAIGDHLDRVRAVMGDNVAGFSPCSTCGGMGLEPPDPPIVQWNAFRMCAGCNGYGQVLTGARNQANAAVDCPRCGGRGFEQRTSAAPPAPPTTAATVEAPAVVADEWGVPSWMGDPAIRPTV